MDTLKILIVEDGVAASTFTIAEIRSANADCPEVEAALRCLEAGAYEATIELGAGGVTRFHVVERERPPVLDVDGFAFVRCTIPRRRHALASYRGTLAEVRAASDLDVERCDATDGRR